MQMDFRSFKNRVGDVFEQACQVSGFRAVTTGADKYGSYVWEAAKTANNLNRYVTLSYTPEDGQVVLFEEILFGADDGQRYLSQAVPYGPVMLGQDAANVDAYILNELPSHIFTAMKAVETIDQASLAEAYIVPRESPTNSTVGAG